MNKRPVLYLLLSAFLVFFVGYTNNKQLDPEYLIVYNALEKSGSENYEIFTMDLDGSNKVNVTKNPAVDWSYMVNVEKPETLTTLLRFVVSSRFSLDFISGY